MRAEQKADHRNIEWAGRQTENTQIRKQLKKLQN